MELQEILNGAVGGADGSQPRMAPAASSIDFEAVYFVLDADYNVPMDVKQRIHLPLIRRFEAERIGSGYPTQELCLQRPRADAPHGDVASS